MRLIPERDLGTLYTISLKAYYWILMTSPLTLDGTSWPRYAAAALLVTQVGVGRLVGQFS